MTRKAPNTGAKEASIAITGLSKSYRRGNSITPVLNGLNLTVPRGKCVFLAGPSGSGKSTLLSILGCILSPDEGSVRVLGQDIAKFTSQQSASFRLSQIGFVFQRYHLIRGLTALENATVPGTLQNAPLAKAQERALELLDALGLGDKAHSLPNNLSTGQCQRIALARALANDPQLILADEPTAALDGANGQLVVQMLRRLAHDYGKTVIVVTHDSRVFELADEIHWLDEGVIQRSETPSQNASPITGANSTVAGIGVAGWSPVTQGGASTPTGL